MSGVRKVRLREIFHMMGHNTQPETRARAFSDEVGAVFQTIGTCICRPSGSPTARQHEYVMFRHGHPD